MKPRFPNVNTSIQEYHHATTYTFQILKSIVKYPEKVSIQGVHLTAKKAWSA